MTIFEILERLASTYNSLPGFRLLQLWTLSLDSGLSMAQLAQAWSRYKDSDAIRMLQGRRGGNA